MIEPVDEKEARSDHHSRQGLRKPGDRAKKNNQKGTPKIKDKSLVHHGGSGGSLHRTHGKNVNFIGRGEGRHDPDHHEGPGGRYDDEHHEVGEWGETIDENTVVTRGVDGVVLDETREAASLIPLEELLVTTYSKKPKKTKVDRYEHIRGMGKLNPSLVPQSNAPNEEPSQEKFPGEDDGFSVWHAIGVDGTEAGDYNDEWNQERNGLWKETTQQRPSYKDMALASISSGSNTTSVTGSVAGQLQSTADSDAGVISLNSSTFGSESGMTEKTDDLP